MAVKAEFSADFKSFTDAVETADVKLADFGKGADVVEKKLNQMVDTFSGRKVIQDATLMAEALEKVGGVATLTDKELAKLGPTAAEAVAKMQKLGMDVPANLQQIADAAAAAAVKTKQLGTDGAAGLKDLDDAAKKTTTDLDKMGDSVEKVPKGMKDAGDQTSGFSDALGTASGVLGAFGLSMSLDAVVSFGKQLLENADALVTLSAKTGMSIEALQKFQIVGGGTSVSIEQVSAAVLQLENRIASGDKSAVGALEKLGVSFSSFKQLAPEDQFIALADALQGISDPAEQVQLAMDLMGKAGVEALPMLKEGFESVASGAAIMSASTVKSLDDMGDAFGAAGQAATTWSSKVLAAVWDAATITDTNSREFKAAVERAAEAAKKATPDFGALADRAHELPADLDAMYKSLSDGAAAQKAAGDAAKTFADAMAELGLAGSGWVKVLDTIDGKVVEAIKSYLAAGVSQKALADAYGLTATQISAVDAARKNELAGLAFEESAKKRLLEIQALTLKATNDQVLANLKARQEAEALQKAELDAALKAEEWWSKAETGTKNATAATHEATKAAGVYMNQLQMIVSDPKIAAFFGLDAKGAVANTLYGGGQPGITPEMAAAMAAGQFINSAGVGAVHINVSHPLGTPEAIAAAVGNALTTRSQATGNRL